MRVGILDILTLPAKNLGRRIYHPIITKQLASITPQAIAVWCRQLGHKTFYAAYYGLGPIERALPDDLDIIFISCFTQTSAIAYALARLYKQKGIRTVIGGAHAKSFPQDCLRFFDIVVKHCDKDLIIDILADNFQPGSFISSLAPFATVPSVEERMPEIKASAFWWGKKAFYSTSIPALSSTGCPYTCNFCTEWNNPYQLVDDQQLTADLRYLSKNHPHAFIVFQDPNFGIKFDEVLNVIDAIPPNQRNPYFAQSSLTVSRTPERLKRLKDSNCVFMSAGIESWMTYSNKAGAGRKQGLEKVNKVVEHFHQINQYIPYTQANFIFGLDTDEGDAPFELTKQFINQVPFAWPAVSIPFPFGGTPLFDEQLANGRILKNMPFSFYYNPYLVITLKNYNPIDYYEKMADMIAYLSHKNTLKQRFKSTNNLKIKSVHWIRTMGARINAKKYKQLAYKMHTDKDFLAFHQGELENLPAFYHQEYEQLLGSYADLLSISDRYPELGQLEPITPVPSLALIEPKTDYARIN